jgi:NitT/TauT family transport system substrate-binding protein
MTNINIQFTRFSAFYSPLITTISGGFLSEEGLEPEFSVAPPGVSAIASIVNGSADVVQSALSQGLTALEKGAEPAAVHFAQINEMDGFFITGRKPDDEFSWEKLHGRDVLVDHGGQPLAMFRYACHRRGIDFSRLNVIDSGSADEMDQAFRDGVGDFVHQQGPAPQQLEHDGVGSVVASVGEAIGPCGFSSLAASRAWLQTEVSKAFMRAYRKARRYINETPAGEVASSVSPFFPNIEPEVLEKTIGFYQQLGCWTPHVEITREAYEVTQDVFEYSGLLSRRYPYEAVCASPPGD